ncbi:MAG: bifunctional oligoribonuclease/PAP phosphatase NrnA, partial [Nitrospinota bacterium]
KERDTFLLSTHVDPDGDAISSVLAMGWLLDKLGKKNQMVIQDEIPYKLRFLAGSTKIQTMRKGASLETEPEVVICLDAPNLSRIGTVSDLLPPGVEVINIDHHESNGFFGAVNIVDKKACSSTEIVFNIVEKYTFPLDRDVAEQIYTGILIDTGRFRFSNTTPKALSISSKLLLAGARPDYIAEWLFHTNSFETITGLRELLNTMQLFLGDQLAVSSFSNTFLTELEGNKMETEGFVNFTLSIDTVKVAALLRESEPGIIRGSLRSKTDAINVNKIAGTFGGGGHARAAGFRCEGSVSDVTQKLLRKLKEYMYDEH